MEELGSPQQQDTENNTVRNLSSVYDGLPFDSPGSVHNMMASEGRQEGEEEEEQEATPVAPLPGDLLRQDYFSFQHGDAMQAEVALQAEASSGSAAWRAGGSPPYEPMRMNGLRPYSAVPSVSGSSQAWDLAQSVSGQQESALDARSFVRSSELREGLDSGDVVVLLHQGSPYTVVPTQLPGLRTDTPQYVLETAAADLEPLPGSHDHDAGQQGQLGPVYDGRCFLEIVRQGEYVGLRSAFAGWRFLQPRRKAPNRLVFFNHNLGVWEQWEVVGSEPWHPWNQTPLLLRSRRLPHVTLSVEVSRVGFYTSAPLAFATPRSLPAAGTGVARTVPVWEVAAVTAATRQPGPGAGMGGPSGPGSVAGSHAAAAAMLLGELGEDENLRRISSAMLVEWFRFVDSEKAVRLRVEEDVARAGADLAALREDAAGQIDGLRAEMNTEIVTLFSVVRAREAQLAAARAARRRALTAAVGALWRRRSMEVSRAVLDAWGAWATRQACLSALAIKGLNRMASRRLAAAFCAWVAATAHSANLATLLARAIMASSRTRLRTAFGGWLRVARSCAAGRSKLEGMAAREIRSSLVAAFSSWLAVQEYAAAARAKAEGLLARREALVKACTLSVWQEEVAASRSCSMRELHAAMRHERTLQRRAISAWASVVQHARVQRATAATLEAKHLERLQLAALSSWSAATKHAATCERKAAALAAKRRAARASAVLWAWHGAAYTKRWQSTRVAKAHANRRTAVLATCMQHLRAAAAQQRLVTRALSRRISSLRASVLHAWQNLCVSARAWRATLAQVAHRSELQRTRMAMQQWLHLSLARTQRRAERVSRLQHTTRAAFAVGMGVLLGVANELRTYALPPLGSPPCGLPPLAANTAAEGSPGSISKKPKARKKHKKRAQAAAAAAAAAATALEAASEPSGGGSCSVPVEDTVSSDIAAGGASPSPAQHPFLSHVTHIAPVTPGSTGSTAGSSAGSPGPDLSGAPAAGSHVQSGTPTSKLSSADACQPSRFAAEASSSAASADGAADAPPSFVPGTPNASEPGTSTGAVGSRALPPLSQAAAGASTSEGIVLPVGSPPLTQLGATASEDGSLSSWLGAAGPQLTGASVVQARARAALHAGATGSALPVLQQGQALSDTDTATSPDLRLVDRSRFGWLLHAAFHAWRAAASQLAAQRQVLEVHAARHECRTAVRVLCAWRQQVHAKQQAYRQAEGLIAQHARTQLRWVLLAWADHTAAAHVVAARVARHVGAKALQRQSAMFAAWQLMVQTSQEARAGAEVLARKNTVGLQRTVFNSWVVFVDTQHTRAAKLARAMMRLSSRRMALVLHAWLGMAQRSTDRASAAAEQLRALRTRQVLQAWACVAAGEVQERQALGRSELRAAAWARAVRCRQVLGALAANVQQAQGLRVKIARGLIRSSTGRLRCALDAWQEHAQRKRALRVKGDRLALRQARRVLHGVFASWLSVCHMAADAHAAADKLAAKRSQDLLLVAFQGWLRIVHALHAARVAAAQAALKREARLRGDVLNAWWSVTQEAASQRLAAELKGRGRERALLAASLNAWAAVCLEDASDGATCGRAADQGHGVARGVGAFQEHVVAQARRRAATRTLRTVVNAWVQLVEARRAKCSMLVLAEARHPRFLAAAVLRNWSLLAALIRVQRLGVERMATRTQRRAVQRMLRHWHMVTAQSRQRMDTLKACIKRKHVAFQLFKAWYWDAFDHDVQQTIRAIFHTTDAAATSPMPSRHTGSSGGVGTSSSPPVSSSVPPSKRTSRGGGLPLGGGTVPRTGGIGSHWSAGPGPLPSSGLRGFGGSSRGFGASIGTVGAMSPYGTVGLSAGAGRASFRAWAGAGSLGASPGTVGTASLGATGRGVSEPSYPQQQQQQQQQLHPTYRAPAHPYPYQTYAGSSGSPATYGASPAASAGAAGGGGWPQPIGPRDLSPETSSRALDTQAGLGGGGGGGGGAQYLAGQAEYAGRISGGGAPSWRTVAENNLFVESLYDNSLFDEQALGGQQVPGTDQLAAGGLMTHQPLVRSPHADAAVLPGDRHTLRFGPGNALYSDESADDDEEGQGGYGGCGEVTLGTQAAGLGTSGNPAAAAGLRSSQALRGLAAAKAARAILAMQLPGTSYDSVSVASAGTADTYAQGAYIQSLGSAALHAALHDEVQDEV